MSKEEVKNGMTKLVYCSPNEDLTVEAIKVPGGVLYVTVMHSWKQLTTTFVKDENIQKVSIPMIDYEKAYKFLTNTEDKNEY